MLPVRVWRYGVDEDLPFRTMLRAGPLVLWREETDICSVMLGEHEIVRRVYSAVRDRNWGTVKPVLSNLQEQVGKDSFRVSFDVDNHEGPIHFTWKGQIAGSADGAVTFSLDGTALTTFLKNRIGFCVLHPDSCADVPCRLTHSDASTEESRFPGRISPHQPFLDLRAMSHEVLPGLWAEVLFEGDVFETEDQRNWTDASYKTYCTPLSIPFPAEIREGTRVRQSVTIRLQPGKGAKVPAARRAPSRAAPRVSYEVDRSGPGKPLPKIGLGSAGHSRELSSREVLLLRNLRPDHLRVDLHLSRADLERVLGRAQREAEALGAGLEAALFLSDNAAAELPALCGHLRKIRCNVARWLVFHSGELCTSERWVALARQALSPVAPGAPFVSGTNAFFTELNRGGPPGPSTDGLVYSVNPQIHTFDNVTIMETLSTQAATVESARAIGGQRPIFVGPITLKPRFNVVATGPEPPVPPGELPPQVDPRQMSLFAAAWTLGSVASLAASGVAGITLFETTGWRGVMEEEAGPPVPARFPSFPGMVFPLYHVLADVGEVKDGAFLAGRSQAPGVVRGLSIRSGRTVRTLLANLTPGSVTARVAAVASSARVRLLDETTVENACRSPQDFRSAPGDSMKASAGSIQVKLLPYAVVRMDWEA